MHFSPCSRTWRRRLGCAAVALLAAAAPARAQTLPDVLATTYQTNPQIEADRARQRSLDDDVARAIGGWRPNVSVTAEAGRGTDTQQTTAAGPPFYIPPYQFSEMRTPETLLLQIQQYIYDGGRVTADIRHSEMVVESGLAQMVSVEQTVLGQAIQAYYDLYRDQQIVQLSKENVAWLQDVVKATHARYLVKDVTQTDVAQAEARLAGGLADLTTAEGNVQTSISAFIAATGVTPGTLAAPPAPPRPLLPRSREDAQHAAETSPDMIMAKFTARAADADVDYAASGLMPTLSLRGTSRHLSETDQQYYNRTDNEVVLSLNIPLYEGGVYAARTRGAKQVAGQRRLEIDETRRKAIDQVNRAWTALMAARANITSISEQVRAAEVARHSIRAEVRVGTRTLYDELLAEQDMMNAKIGLLRAQHDEAVASYSVLGAIGELTAKALDVPTQLYDPSVHYEKVRDKWWGTGIDESYDKPPQTN